MYNKMANGQTLYVASWRIVKIPIPTLKMPLAFLIILSREMIRFDLEEYLRKLYSYFNSNTIQSLNKNIWFHFLY